MHQSSNLPAGIFPGNQRIHFRLDLFEGFPVAQPPVQINAALAGYCIERRRHRGDIRQHHRAALALRHQIFVQLLHPLDDLRHLINRILALFRRRTMGGDAVGDNPHLCLALMSQGNDIVAGLTDHAVIRLPAAGFIKMLEVHAIAVFLTDRTGDIDRLALQQSVFLGFGCGKNGSDQSAFHIHGASAPDAAVHNLAGEGRNLPQVPVLHPDGIHMPVKLENLWTVPHTTDDIAGGINMRLIIAQTFHQLQKILGNLSLLVRIAADLYRLLYGFYQLFHD